MGPFISIHVSLPIGELNCSLLLYQLKYDFMRLVANFPYVNLLYNLKGHCKFLKTIKLLPISSFFISMRQVVSYINQYPIQNNWSWENNWPSI